MTPIPTTEQTAPVRGAGLVERGIAGAVQVSLAAVRLPVRAARPIILSDTLRPVRDVADAAVRRVVDAFASVIAEQLQHNLEVQALIEAVTERVLHDLMTRESTTTLVRAQVEGTIGALAADAATTRALVAGAAHDFLGGLAQNPTALRPLVRSVVGDTVAHIAAQPSDVNALVEVVATDFMATLRERPLLVDGLVRTLAGRYIDTLAAQPAQLDALVQGVGNRLIERLAAEPAALDALVQAAGDRYLEHLHANPENVQDLLANQSVTMATEVVTEVRSGSAAADSALENLVRGLLRKKPRTELAPHHGAAAGG